LTQQGRPKGWASWAVAEGRHLAGAATIE